MNYRHIYHAGNFADVFKHLVLISLLQSLKNKETPYCYIDTHAGIGLYDLHSIEAQKTKEYVSGIEQLINYVTTQKNNISPNIPEEVQTYLDVIKTYNKDLSLPLHYYPGSPNVARSVLRPNDKMILSELHPSDVTALKQEFRGDNQVSIHEMDGYQALNAFLPPKIKRGVVLIDPPFEKENEVSQIFQALKIALQKWETGIYAIWYPLKKKHLTLDLYRQLNKLNAKEILNTELSIIADDTEISFKGSGIAIINPPWKLQEKLSVLMSWLWNVLSPEKKGGFRVGFHNKM